MGLSAFVIIVTFCVFEWWNLCS